MAAGIEFNKSYTSSYFILPLKKNNGQFSVTCSDRSALEKIAVKDSMKYIEDLRKADIDKNNIISLDEIENCKHKTNFMENLERAMKKFNSNPNKF